MDKKNIDTICVRGADNARDNFSKYGTPRQLPIIQSTSFTHDTIEQQNGIIDLKHEGYLYTRFGNPTNDAVAEKIAKLDGGISAVLVSSGQSANFLVFLTLCNPGDHILCSSAIYGETINLLDYTLKRFGVTTTYFHPDDPSEKIAKLVKKNTKLIFAESLSNPALIVLDYDKISKIAKKNYIPLVIDNSITPITCKPFKHGADIITYSTSKYMDGSASIMGGAIVDSGNFDWVKHASKYPNLGDPDPSNKGVKFTQRFGSDAFIRKLVHGSIRDFGCVPSPINSFFLNTHLESLHVRMQRHCENSIKVAKFLDQHKSVNWVNHPMLEDDKYNKLAHKYMSEGSNGLVSFGIKGGVEKLSEFIKNLKFISYVSHMGDARTCILHPLGTVGENIDRERLRSLGFDEDLIRITVGLENIDDILADLSQALDKI